MKKMMAIIFFVGVLIVTSCDKSSTEPEAQIKTPDEMTWIADTLKRDYSSISLVPQDLKVFSPNDVWLVCDGDISRGLLWHYDGKNWKESNLYEDVGDVKIFAIEGNSSSDLWVGGLAGTKSFLGHFDGTKWTRYSKEFNNYLVDITKDNKGNFWACGMNGLILKYSNGIWEENYVNFNLNSNSMEKSAFFNILFYNNEIHLLGLKFWFGRKDVHYHVKGKFNNWAIVDSQTYNDSRIYKFGYGGFATIDNKLYSYGVGGIWKYTGNQWQNIFKSDIEIINIDGLNENYLLAVGLSNKLYFYDGNSWSDKSTIVNNGNYRGFLRLCRTDGKYSFLASLLTDIHELMVKRGN